MHGDASVELSEAAMTVVAKLSIGSGKVVAQLGSAGICEGLCWRLMRSSASWENNGGVGCVSWQ